MNKTLIVPLALALALGGGYGAYRLGLAHGTHAPAAPGAAPASPLKALPQGTAEGEDATRRHIASGLKAGDTDPLVGRPILYYHDPMAPASRFDKPGKSPFMDMMLVPVYGGGSDDKGSVSVSPRMQQNLGLRTATVTEGRLPLQLTAPGSIGYNERDQSVLQARTAGYVERLHVRAAMDRVQKGQPLLELYLPDWIAAQEELLSLKRQNGPDLAALIEGARQRMRLLGMDEALIRSVEAAGQPQARLTLRAPGAGVITELAVREGMNVAPGTTLLRINGLGTVWAVAEVPEAQAAQARPGTRVQASSPAWPGQLWSGRVQTVLPEVSSATRTVRARVELANADGRLLPGMFVNLQWEGTQGAASLLIPSEAVIQTGRRTVVMLAEDGGRFRSAEIETGQEANGQTEVRRGLAAGQKVVVSGQFLLDSEASLRNLESRLNPSGPVTYKGIGRVDSIERDSVMLQHEPIAELKWGAMTMEFKLPAGPTQNPPLKPGDAVSFEFQMQKDGVPQITRIGPRQASAAPGAMK